MMHLRMGKQITKGVGFVKEPGTLIFTTNNYNSHK